MVARDLGVEPGECLVFREAALHEEFFPLQGEPLKFGPGGERPGERLLKHHRARRHGLGQGPHPGAAREQGLAARVAIIQREVDRRLLHRAVGLHHRRLAEGDVLLIVDPFDVGDRPAFDPKPDLHVALDGQIDEVVGGQPALAAARPVPVGAGRGAHVVEPAAQDCRLRQRHVELGLRPRGPGPVDVAVFREWHREPAAEFAGVGGEPLEVVGGEVAVAGAEATEHRHTAIGQELLCTEVRPVVFVGAGRERVAGARDVGIEGAHGAREPAGGDPAFPLHGEEQGIVHVHALQHLAERERRVAVVGGGARDRRLGGREELRSAGHLRQLFRGRGRVVLGDIGKAFEQVFGGERLGLGRRGGERLGGLELQERLLRDARRRGRGGGLGFERRQASSGREEPRLGGRGRGGEEEPE